jgi:amino acid adenylation domain-containing protein
MSERGVGSVRSVRSGFLAAARRFPDRPALAIQDERLSYRELLNAAASVAATMQRGSAGVRREARLTGVFGHRSFAAFTGVLGALLRGDGYVPLNPIFPAGRNREMALRARLDWIVVERASLDAFAEMLDGLEADLNVVLPDSEDAELLRARFPRHKYFCASELLPAATWEEGDVDPNGIAYLLFTSGSTGKPKGVMVAHRNVVHFLDVMQQRYALDENDRVSQTFDLTFDLSAFDMFMAWQVGACLCCPTQQEKLLPARYIKSHGITVWFSVPSTAALMNKLRMLKPANFPTIRYSLFCGEGLPLEVAEAFQRAAPQSILENLYGPTELTIACTLYRYDRATIGRDAHLGLIPIGEPYPGMVVLVADESLRPVPPGEPGELLMTGAQLSLGYLDDPVKTAAAFVTPPGRSDVYYRTGDRVRRQPSGPLVYLGRIDNQIKIQGYRVELGEIEAVIREVAATEIAIALGYPLGPSGADGVVGFISKPGADLEAIRDAARARLPAYMQPSSIYSVDEFPLNPNGKVDRKALLETLQQQNEPRVVLRTEKLS